MGEDNVNRHFYLYAKGHYQTTEVMKDLIKIQSYRTGVNPEHLTAQDVYITIMDLAYTHITNVHEHNKFMRNTGDYLMKCSFVEAAIKSCIIILALSKVKDIPFYLGEADPEVLPVTIGSDA